MKFITNEIKGKTIITNDGIRATVICSSKYRDVIIMVDGKVKCIHNGNYIVV